MSSVVCLPPLFPTMVKEKINSIRIYDEDGYRLRAACVCVRDETEQEILLISAGRNKGHWIVPGGGIEPKEDACGAAVREVYEEAGVRGLVGRCLGVFKNPNCKTKTSVFLLIVEHICDEWEEKSLGRKRKWFSTIEARQHLGLHRPEQGIYLDVLLKQRIETQPPQQQQQNGLQQASPVKAVAVSPA